MKDYELMISQFVDNELSVSEQQELFLFLAENEVGREMLSDFIEIKKETKSFYSGLNVEMENEEVITIDKSEHNKKERKQKRMFYFSAAAAILFGFLFLLNQFKENPVVTKYQNLQTEMIELQESYSNLLENQTDLIKLNNQLYVGTQKRKTSKGNRDNNNSIKTKPSKGKKQLKNKSGNSISPRNRGRMLASLQNIQIIKITKNDFLGEQIIGN